MNNNNNNSDPIANKFIQQYVNSYMIKDLLIKYNIDYDAEFVEKTINILHLSKKCIKNNKYDVKYIIFPTNKIKMTKNKYFIIKDNKIFCKKDFINELINHKILQIYMIFVHLLI